MSALRLRMRRLFSRETGRKLAWIGALLAGAVAVNLIGIRIAGNVGAWQQWMTDHASYFLAWRLLLYGATAYGWWWMRRRLLAREQGNAARPRLLRAEVAAVVVVILLEGSLLLRTV